MTERHHKRWWRRSINWTYVDRSRVVIEIIAFLVAGIWALYTFWIGEHRTYQEGGALESTLEWHRTPDGDCSTEYTVTFHNVSKIPVTISTAKLKVWRMKKSTPNGPDEAVRYVIPLDLRQDPLLETETDRFNGTYQPDESDEEGFTFDVNKAEPGPILFELTLWDEDGLNKLKKEQKSVLSVPDDDYSYRGNNRWGSPCFEKPNEPEAKTDSSPPLTTHRKRAQT
jgi:hypothetical protein